ncbi:MAG: 16S rRNA (adenine(1518)-N(6)/adenine(1519)-N(6))-dimethyltransferase RsmA [Nitrospirota bacterium]
MAKKYLGQNFLYDPSILRKIIEIAELDKDDLVIEIGPGPGRLTRMLAERVKKVIAIELDYRLFEELKEQLSEFKNIELVYGDALKHPYENLSRFKVVANIPYYITTPIIFKLLEVRKNIETITLTVQKEVAERIVAKPGGKDYGLLSITVQYCAKPFLKFVIPKEAFRPIPKVDSAVLYMRILEKPAAEVRDEKFFFRIIRAAFSQRRKKLSNSLKVIRADIKEKLNEAGIDLNRRPETLSIEEFARLANILL